MDERLRRDGRQARRALERRRAAADRVSQRLSTSLGRRDTQADIALGQDIADRLDGDDLGGLVELLDDEELASSAIKAIYECGYLAPQLLVPEFDRLVALLDARHNRMVWGGMIAVSCVATVAPDLVWTHAERIQEAHWRGTVITKVTSVRALSRVAAANPVRAMALVSFFEAVLGAADPKQLVSEAEDILPAMPPEHREGLLAVLVERGEELLTKSARSRLLKLVRRTGGLHR